MKKSLLLIMLGFAVCLTIACKHPGKEIENISTTLNSTSNTEDITKDVFVDNFGDKLEVIINNSNNTATIHLDGKTYELKKSNNLPDYTASDAEYQYSNIKGNIIFLNKDYDMVIFQYKQNNKNPKSTKMASY
ncbi:hypothetical protein D1632_15670 [Chryseobacterium nematophagum]|uniref:C-type lysozyme inhibitor domain-containing protein n=1 Tax=Chryseobacterium nematophagum TaxID=2305228 RepID=A0A3M7LBV2_9FLAO|nr:multicopper oxidase domain-containing protein [Chryseobacterium nematophagum]RMZ59002.1 hypothetical protein D1632_15670 [Chryseobacterium nematophagum]